MSQVGTEDIMDKTGSIFKLVILTARRAYELHHGAPKLVEMNPNTKLTTVALEEVRQGKITYKTKLVKETA